MKIIVDAMGGLVCDRSQREMNGTKRAGSGQNSNAVLHYEFGYRNWMNTEVE